MNKTRKPEIAGYLCMASGFINGAMVLLSLFVIGVATEDPMSDYMFIFPLLFAIAGIIAVVGCISALERKRWWLALTGSIAALFAFLIPGAIAITLIIQSKKEFESRTRIKIMNEFKNGNNIVQ